MGNNKGFAPMHEHPVLIVGGGPAGIVTAIELARRGVPVRIIDRKISPVASSRAFTIHAKTLEIFENWGIVEQYLKLGLKSFGFVFNFKGLEKKPTLDFRILRSRYPYIVVLGQADTERLLREHLESSHGLGIEWGMQLTELKKQDDGTLLSTLKDVASGEEMEFQASYVVGADGVHSFVRKSFDLPFEGEAYEGMIMQMMDTVVEGYNESPDWTQYFIEKENFLLTTPLPNGQHRLLVSDMGESADRKKESRPEAFQRIMKQHNVDGIVKEPEWTTQWVLWKRIADIYRSGNVFLCGDSAHVHSPSGGQGMNSCIQDAWNLGWKLAMSWNGNAKPALLDSYEVERKQIAEQLIEGTDAMHEIIMAHGKGLNDRMELTQSENWQIEVTERVAGVSYTYFGYNDLPEGFEAFEFGPRIGDRAPDVDLPKGRTLYGYLKRPNLTLLIMPGEKWDASIDVVDTVGQDFGNVMSTIIVADKMVDDLNSDNVLIDPDHALNDLYGTSSDGLIYVIRPDGYVGFKCRLPEVTALRTYLDKFFHSKVNNAA